MGTLFSSSVKCVKIIVLPPFSGSEENKAVYSKFMLSCNSSVRNKTSETFTLSSMAWFSSIFYFIFGFATALYIVILWSKVFGNSKSDDQTKSTAVKFYLNIFFLDRKELLRNIVRSKISRNLPLLRAAAKRAAVALLNNVIVEKVAANLCKVIPENLGKMGIRCSVNIIFTKASFLCIEVAMTKVDIPTLIEFNAGETAGQKVRDILERASFPKLNEAINSFLLNFFEKKLMEKLPMQLKQKLQDKMYADLEIVACTEEDLGSFLAQTLYQLNISPGYVGTEPVSTVSPEK
jgi:hypothetical protein